MKRILVLLALSVPLLANEREERTRIDFGGQLPKRDAKPKEGAPPPKPLFVVVDADGPTQDQQRFETILADFDTVKLCRKRSTNSSRRRPGIGTTSGR